MKTRDVPQDLTYFKDYAVRDVLYAVDENGHYKQVISDGWSVKNDALELVWNEIHEECEDIRQQVLAKKVSPLAYHIKKSLLTVSMLSSYSEIPKRKIKKHLIYNEFMKLDDNTLQKYADAMRITIKELKQTD